MGIADLVDTITAAARPHLPGIKVALAEDTIADLPALVVGWPAEQVLNVTYGGGRDIELTLAIYVAVGADGSKAWRLVQDVVDGPLIAALNDALQPSGVVTAVEQVVPVLVGPGEIPSTRALRIPLAISTSL
jgi:hypothetical protein